MSWQIVVASGIFVIGSIIAGITGKESLSLLLAGAAAGLLVPHKQIVKGKEEQ